MQHNFRKKRQMACIMFTDIVGYTLLMSKNESLALKTLDANRYIHKSLISKYGGEWIKEMGDGVLAIFSNATDAVYAASEIHVASKNNKHLNLRIGLHLSEIIYDNGDIFGDGVNIAARIEPTAPVGGIHISHEVYSNLNNKQGLETKFVGDYDLKNVNEAIKIYQVTSTPDFVNKLSQKASNYEDRSLEDVDKSIAIIPFANMTNDTEQDYFCEGIAEDILITLSNIRDLKVVGRSSSFQFKKSELSEKEICSVLNVNHILSGSVRRSGNKLRINAMLYNVHEESQVWAERYDRELSDIFEIQDDITSKITKQLKVTLFKNLTRANPVSMEAYEMLLKGRYYEEMLLQGFDKALSCYTRAIEIEPDYAEAYSALASLHFYSTMHLIQTPREGFRKAKYFAEKALSINKEIAGAYFVLGQVAFWFDWEFDNANRQYEKAAQAMVPFYFSGVTIDPWYHAFVLGDFETAINNTMKIIESDPLSFFNQYLLSLFYTLGKQSDKARTVINNMLLMAPNYSEGHRLLAYNSFLDGDSKRAVKEAKKAVEVAEGLGWSQITLGIVLAQNGRTEEAQKILDKLKASRSKVKISPLGIGLIFTYLNDFDNAFKYLEMAIEYKDNWLVSLKYGPEYDPLRSDPRFDVLLEQIGYPD